MEEDTEFKKLPVEERCVHKLWKARLHGYEETIKIFREIDDEKSAEWQRFVYLMKKFVADAHAMAQERGLEATLIFVENCAAASKVVGDVMSAIVQKCIAAQRTRTRELAVQVSLMYIEMERQETVVEELIKGMEHKNPKIVVACITAVTDALREFGHKVVGVKPLVKQIGRLMADRDKAVRTETKTMTVELYRWIREALKPQLAALPALVVSELEAEFCKISKDKAEPTRYLKSQQAKVNHRLFAAASVEDGAAEADNADDEDAGAIDPMDLIDPVDILAQLPKDFYDKLEEKKWQTRKEALEALEVLLKNPKLMPGDYGEVVKALKKVVAKDTNVVLVAMAGKCMAALARGLGKKFSPYAQVCVSAILEKFKEKKAAVVAALRDAIDSIYPSTSLESMQEDLFEALASKNPSVKSETNMFLARAFTKTLPAVFNKKFLKALTGALIKTLNESDPSVRDASAEALGTLQKLLGEKMLATYLADVDALKMAKIKEFSENAVIVVKIPAAKKVRPATAKPEPVAPLLKAPSVTAVKRPVSSVAPGVRKMAPKKASSLAAPSSARSGGASTVAALPTERELTPEEVAEKAADLLPANCLAELGDANWKSRLSASETLLNAIGDLTPRPELSQLLCKVLCQKPGLKDTNFQVVKMKLEAIQRVVETFKVTTITADFMVNDVTEKLSDIKNCAVAANVLTALAESLNLQYILGKVLGFAFEQKSPKVQSEALLWAGRAITEFGMQANPKLLIDDLKRGVASTNPTVRQAAFSVLGTLFLYTGNSLLMFFDSEKPAIKQQIQAEFDKNAGQRPAAPIRGPAAKQRAGDDGQIDDNGNADNGGGGDYEEEATQAVNLKDLIPRVDISSHITEAFLAEMADKNWKTRNEGLTKLQVILNDAKMIRPNIGDLPHMLGQRLVDSNAKIAQTALAICQQLAEAMGPPCRQHVRAFFPGFLNGLGDGKQFIRTASITCMNVWGNQCGFKEFFEGEMLADALKAGSPALRAELWCWLAEKMPTIAVKQIAKDELVPCLPYLYLNICDRNADVRKHANDAVHGFMLHLGYEPMVKALEKVKPSSKKDVQAVLDKTRPNMPVKPLPPSKQQAPIIDDPKSARSNQSAAATKIQKAPSGSKINAAASSAASRKKEEEVDTSPMLAVNNLKNQRMLDEQKMKVLKWNFTSPREEFIELLRDQMTTANVNKALMANMFHDDFRYHLKAIDTLLDDLAGNAKALICNLDLILKWISLRFYDTNPSVLLKGLDYLTAVFTILDEQRYMLADAEVGCFIPHLLIKIGDPKDTVRNAVRNLIINQICPLYSAGKVFTYIMDGLKSKNARQRTECLDTMGAMIEMTGINVCQPTPSSALKEVARHISDRDNSVRSAALNCVVQAYFLTGEKVYKMIGNLSEKDLSMLDERIKRAKKTKRPTPEPVVPVAAAAGSPSSRNASGNSGDGSDDNDDDPSESTPEEPEAPKTPNTGVPRQIEIPITVTKPRVTGPFGLDPNVIADIEKDWVRVDDFPPLAQRPPVDMDFLNSPLAVSVVNGVSYPVERLKVLMNRTHQLMNAEAAAGVAVVAPNNANGVWPRSSQTSINPAHNLPKDDEKLLRPIRAIASQDSIAARAALNEINDILESPERHAAMRDYEDLYITSICMQFKHLGQQPTNESLTMYQPVLSSMYTFFTTKTLGKNLSVESLELMMSVLLGLMADNKLTSGDDGQYTKVINGICLRILERTDFTKLNCALIRLLRQTCATAGLPKFTDLLMKCIWRNVKVMPEKAHELEYGPILQEINEFMTMLPSTWWAQRPVDTPLRTIKTIIHNMAKLKGNDILQYLSAFPQTELHAYLMRVLKNIHKENNTAALASSVASPTPNHQGPQDSNKMISKQTHEAMSNIFKLIAHKDRNHEGIAQLHEFKKQHPDLDMAPFLRGANPVFLKFIEDGLADIDRQQHQTNGTGNHAASGHHYLQANNPAMGHVLADAGQSHKSPEYWAERLIVLKNRAKQVGSGYENYSNTYKKTVVDHNMATSELPVKIVNPERPISSNRLELLQEKLAQFRHPKP